MPEDGCYITKTNA